MTGRGGRAAVASGALLLFVAAAPGGAPADLRRLFPQQAEVTAPNGRLARLELPAAILAACRPDLSDLRLFDEAGLETRYLVDAGALASTTAELVARARPAVVDVARNEIRRETGPPLRREAITIELPAQAPESGRWAVLFATPSSQFVARIRIEAAGAASDASLLHEGSIYRLPSMHGAESLRLPLPPDAPRRVRVVLESESPAWIEPTITLESARRIERAPSVAVPLAILSTTRADGKTTLDLSRPPGIVPDRLRVETSTPLFDRPIEASDLGPAGAGRLGAGRLFRFPGLVPIGEQEIGLARALGDRIRVTIDDGDSPALEGLAFAAVIRQPALIFMLSGAAGPEARGMLRFGGGRAHPPRYDLSGLLPMPGTTLEGDRARAAALLADPAALPAARLGPVGASPDYDGTPALQFALHAGAALDPSGFSHHRAIVVADAAEGLSRIPLEPDDLAVLSEGAGDLRIIDDASRQWPYLTAPDDAPAMLPLSVSGPESRDRVSRYRLGIPVGALTFDRLVLDVDGGFVDRSFRLEGTIDTKETHPITSGRLTRPIDDPRPLTIDARAVRARALTLSIDDGDDAPLLIRGVTARVPRPAIFLAAPAGRYEMLLGSPDQEAPRYEMEQARGVVLSVRAEPVAVGALEPNPRHSLAARWRGAGARRTMLLWGTLVTAVVVLGFLTLRLARRPTSSGS